MLSQNIQAIILLTSALATGCIETPRALRDAPEQRQALVDQNAPDMNLVTQDMHILDTDALDLELDYQMPQADAETIDMFMEADMQAPAQDMFIEADMNEIDQEVQDMFIEEDMQAPQADMMVEPEQTCQVELVYTPRVNTFVLGSEPTLYSFQINTNLFRPAVEEVEVAFSNADGALENNIDRSVEVVSFRDEMGSSWIEMPINGLATFQDLDSETLSYNVILETQNSGRDQAMPINNITTEINAVIENENGDEIVCEPANSASFNLSPIVLKFTELNSQMVDLNFGLNRNISFDFNVNTNLDENLNEFNGILSGRLTNVTFAIQSQNVDLSSLVIRDNQGLERNTINVAGQTLDLFSVELEEPIVLESGDVSVGIDLDVSNMQPNGFISLEVIDVTYSTGFRDHQVTQEITTEPVILITQD